MLTIINFSLIKQSFGLETKFMFGKHQGTQSIKFWLLPKTKRGLLMVQDKCWRLETCGFIESRRVRISSYCLKCYVKVMSTHKGQFIRMSACCGPACQIRIKPSPTAEGWKQPSTSLNLCLLSHLNWLWSVFKIKRVLPEKLVWPTRPARRMNVDIEALSFL